MGCTIMADLNKRLAKGTMTTIQATAYTVPALTTTYVKSLLVSNKTASDATFTFFIAGVEMPYQHTIKANDMIAIPFLDAILSAAETIDVVASANTTINYVICGREVS